jgi:Kef-type K+ transport system membrane component KefB/nucleotide-binding universal stress UspA family protein
MIELPLHSPSEVFLVLGFVILVAPLLAERARLPGVIGLVVAGVVIGPEGFGLLARTGAIEQLGGFGLLYLMFLAGLELDLDVLSSNRRRALMFGAATFAVPVMVALVTGLMLGFGGYKSALLGALFASHTLVAYPIIRRSGIVTDASVAVTVGATIITDTLALVLLAAVAGSYGEANGMAFALRLGLGLAVLGFAALSLLPRVARWFFTGLGQDRTLRFLFILVAFLSAAVVAELVGVEGIVGAFLAGLSLNALVPNGGALMQRVEFVGSALFIPIFLISIGMLVDPTVAFDRRTLALAAVMAMMAMAAKWLAAEVVGRAFRFLRAQIGVMFSLSNAHAAAALAVTIVGFEIGLFDERIVNAVLIVILVTVIVSSWVAARSAPRVPPPVAPPVRLGRTVLVPISNPDTARDVVRLATWVSRADGGQVAAFHVVTAPQTDRVKAVRPVLSAVESKGGQLGTEVETFVRVDRSIASGVLNTAVERDATLVMLGWRGVGTIRGRLFGSLIEDIIDRTPCAVAACWLSSNAPRRVVFVPSVVGDTLPADVITAGELVRRLARGSGLPVVVLASAGSPGVLVDSTWSWVDVAGDGDALVAALKSGDLVVVPGTPGRSSLESMVERLVGEVPECDVVVVHAGTPVAEVGVGEMFAGR